MKTNSPYHCWADCVQKCCNFPGDVIRVMWLDNQASSFCREKCKIIVPHEVYLNMMINKWKMESTDTQSLKQSDRCVWLIPVFYQNQVYRPGISRSWRLSRNSTLLLEVFLRPGVLRMPTQAFTGVSGTLLPNVFSSQKFTELLTPPLWVDASLALLRSPWKVLDCKHSNEGKHICLKYDSKQ